MSPSSFLTFRVRGRLLGVDAELVRSIVWLPELTRLEEYPPSIAGVFVFRGTIVAVMDLNLRFGYAAEKYDPADRVILLSIPEHEARGRRCGPLLLGVIAHEVYEVADIPAEAVERPPFPGREEEPHPFFVGGAAMVGGEVAMVIDPLKIVDFDFDPGEAPSDASEAPSEPDRVLFCPEADPETRALFRSRARELRQAPAPDDPTAAVPLAVIGLNGEYRCVEMKHVREFTALQRFAPVPCCPERIVGVMNLRGGALTLVDLRPLLKLPQAPPTAATSVMVVEVGGTAAGVVVDEIVDVIYPKATELVPLGSADAAAGENLVKGSVRFGNRIVALLDLEAIVSGGQLAVNDPP